MIINLWCFPYCSSSQHSDSGSDLTMEEEMDDY